MQQTIQLLDAAIAQTGLSQRQLSEEIGLSPTALSVQRGRGFLTPETALLIADRINESREQWTTLAVVESERDSGLQRRLKKALTAIRNS